MLFQYISLAINKYILQTATIPKKDDNSLYWDKLKTNDYLGSNFNTTNPITSSELKVTFDRPVMARLFEVTMDVK